MKIRLLVCAVLVSVCAKLHAQSTGIFVNSSNNVGIGTTSPASDSKWASPALDISGTTGTAIIRTTAANGIATLRMTGPGTNHIDDWTFVMNAGNASTFSIFPQEGIIGAAFTITNAGKVGIGTTSPSTNLNIAANTTENGLTTGQFQITGSTNANQRLVLGYDTTNDFGFIEAGIAGSLVKNIVLDPHGGGNVGIGTTSPGAKLDVEGGGMISTGTMYLNGYTVNSGSTSLILNNGYSGGTGNVGETYALTAGIPNANEGGFSINRLTGYTYGSNIQSISSSVFTILGGKVGINTISSGYALDVNGQVHAASFVSATQTYADYVFKPGYKLEPLSDVEASIKKDGHLPGIPSEADAKAHGIDLASMQVKLLQKIEELTLHQIDEEKHQIEQEKLLENQNKRLDEQSQRIEQLEKENTELRAQH